MRNSRFKYLTKSIEDAELAAIDDGDVEAVTELDEDTMVESDGIAADAAELEATGDDIENATSDVGAADSIIETAESTITPDPEAPDEEPAGMSEEAAAIATEMLDYLLGERGLGVLVESPSMERFRSANSRYMVTKQAVESWKDSAKKAWDAVVAAVSGMLDKVMKFIERFLNQSLRIKKTADGMQKTAATANESKEKEVSAKSWGGAFAHVGVTAGDIDKVLATHKEATIGLANVMGGLKATVAEVNSAKGAPGGVTGILKSLKGAETDGDGVAYKGLVGNKTIKVTTTDGKTTVVADGTSTTPPEKVAIFSSQDMTAICGNVSALATQTYALQKLKGETSKAIAELKKVANSAARWNDATAKEGGKEEGAQAGAKDAKAAVMSAASSVSKLISMIPDMNVKVMTAALKAVSANLSAYGLSSSAPGEAKAKAGEPGKGLATV